MPVFCGCSQFTPRLELFFRVLSTLLRAVKGIHYLLCNHDMVRSLMQTMNVLISNHKPSKLTRSMLPKLSRLDRLCTYGLDLLFFTWSAYIAFCCRNNLVGNRSMACVFNKRAASFRSTSQ